MPTSKKQHFRQYVWLVLSSESRRIVKRKKGWRSILCMLIENNEKQQKTIVSMSCEAIVPSLASDLGYDSGHRWASYLQVCDWTPDSGLLPSDLHSLYAPPGCRQDTLLLPALTMHVITGGTWWAVEQSTVDVPAEDLGAPHGEWSYAAPLS